MVRRKLFWVWHTIVIGLVVSIAGCAAPNLPQPTPTMIQVSATPWETSTARRSPTNVPTETLALLLTDTPTRTVRPTRTATQTVTPTWTPLPTLPADQAQTLVIELLRTNGGCKLPCWWGITPGKTSWPEAKAFLSTFATTINNNPFVKPPNAAYGVTFDGLPKNISKGLVGAAIGVENGIVQSVTVDIYFPLSEILSIHGQPDEIWIYVRGFTLIPQKPFFVLALFYARQGVLAVYEGSAEAKKVMQVCPYRIPSVEHRWYFWNPEQDLTFKAASKKVLLEAKEYRLVEEAAGIDTQTFIEIYKDPANGRKCFDVDDPNYP